MSGHQVVREIEDAEAWRLIRRGLLAIGTIAALALIAGLALGCAHVREGQDALVVRAQQDIEAGFEVADTFLRIEAAHREELAAKAPWAPSIANQIRERWPGLERTAWAALDTYRAAKQAASEIKDANSAEAARAEQARVEAREAMVLAVQRLTVLVEQARLALQAWGKGGGS